MERGANVPSSVRSTLSTIVRMTKCMPGSKNTLKVILFCFIEGYNGIFQKLCDC